MGEAPAWELVKASRLKRPTVYTALGSLEKKGLVTSEDKKKIIHFSPVSPTELLTIADEKYEVLSRTKKDLQTILPNLLSTYTLSTEKPVVRTYEGVEGIKQVYLDTIAEGKTIYAVAQVTEVEPAIHKWLEGPYMRKRVGSKVHAKVIVSATRGIQQYLKKDISSFRTTITVPATTFPFEQEMNIYGDKVAFIHHKKGEPLIGIIITHAGIAKTMKASFDLMWLGAETIR
jgi:sugar-specific transcriptional regulator TrmB